MWPEEHRLLKEICAGQNMGHSIESRQTFGTVSDVLMNVRLSECGSWNTGLRTRRGQKAEIP